MEGNTKTVLNSWPQFSILKNKKEKPDRGRPLKR